MPGTSAICLIVATLTLGAEVFPRTFTDTRGKTLTGTFVRLEGDKVTIKMDNGEVTFPIDRLSVGDRVYVRAQARAAEEERAASEPAETEEQAVPLKPKGLPNNVRAWTNQQGQVFNGKFVRMHNGSVVLQGGSLVTVPFANLSANDQLFVRELLESRGEADLIPQIVENAPNNFNNSFAGGPAGIPPPVGSGFPGNPNFPNVNRTLEENQRRIQEIADREAQQQREAAERMAESRRQLEEANRRRMEEQQQRTEAQRIAANQRAEEARRRREEQQNQIASSLPTGPRFGPPAVPSSNIPTPQMPEVSIPAGYEGGYVCESCNKPVSDMEARGERCPHCNTYWSYKPDELPQPKNSGWDFSDVRISGRGLKGLIALVILIIGGFIRFVMYLSGNSDSSSSSTASSSYYPPPPTSSTSSTNNQFPNNNPFG